MLTNVHLKNLALIREADIDLTRGLNIMTGETGSGKSIIIGAVNIALGAKANKGMIRSGESQALVELTFSSLPENVRSALSELDIALEEDSLLITRKIGRESSTTRINGENVTLSDLKRITALLVDVHGQHEHQSLLDPSKHLGIVDAFAKEETDSLKKRIAAELEIYRSLRKEYASSDLKEEDVRREVELLTHEVKEIEDVQLSEGEDEALEAEYKKLQASGDILKAVSKAARNLDEEPGGILSQTQDAAKHIKDVISFDEELKEIFGMLSDLDSLSKEVSASLSHYMDRNQFDAERYHQVSERLDRINHVKSRYGNTIPEILAYKENASKKLEFYQNYAERKEELMQKMRVHTKEMNVLSTALSKVRKEAAEKLEPRITAQLKDLNFADVRFSIDFQKTERIGANGFDKVEFLIAANPGEELAPLAKVASGGELSRIMLALKSAAATEDEIPTLIFDEIDTGISGFTAQKVAEKLNLLSQEHQIICITHLPQIAAMADHHLRICKSVEDGSTISGVTELSGIESEEEIARMVGGAELTEAARANARELKQAARALKGTV